MYWTLELAQYLADAPWPATKDELIDYAIRTGAPMEVVENLQAAEGFSQLEFTIHALVFPDPTKESLIFTLSNG